MARPHLSAAGNCSTDQLVAHSACGVSDRAAQWRAPVTGRGLIALLVIVWATPSATACCPDNPDRYAFARAQLPTDCCCWISARLDTSDVPAASWRFEYAPSAQNRDADTALYSLGLRTLNRPVSPRHRPYRGRISSKPPPTRGPDGKDQHRSGVGTSKALRGGSSASHPARW